MPDKEERNNLIEMANELKSVLGDLLRSGDWESSIFLKNYTDKIRTLESRVDSLIGADKQVSESEQSVAGHVVKDPEENYVRVFILLYQVDGANLQGWYRAIKNLEEHDVTRPVYTVEDNAKEVIRSKVSNIDRNGYVVVDVKKSEVYESDTSDVFNHKVFSLKENAIDLKNVVEFIHANKKRYLLSGDGLVFLG